MMILKGARRRAEQVKDETVVSMCWNEGLQLFWVHKVEFENYIIYFHYCAPKEFAVAPQLEKLMFKFLILLI